MAQAKRPGSPHLQVYRWSVTMASSILHRATGVALGAGTLLLTWWLLAAATSDEAFALVQLCMGSMLGQLVMLGFVWALTYHLFNGLRHLVWDMGYGFEMKTAQISGWLSLLGSAVVTLAIAVFSMGGTS